MPTREPALAGGVVARRRDRTAVHPPATRPQRLSLPGGGTVTERWTTRKSVLVAFSGAAILWLIFVAALTVLRG